MDEDEILRQAMSILGKRNSAAKDEARRRNWKKRKPLTEQTRQKMIQGQAARREREKSEKVESTTIKRPRGRPKKTV